MRGQGPIRLPTPEDRELWDLVHEYVTPGMRYLELLHGNFVALPGWKRAWFLRSLHADARRISDEQLLILLSSEWRSRLTAAWLIATSSREQFVGELGNLFTASALTYSGQGYAIALAAIGGPSSVAELNRYLQLWLPRLGKRYDQCWAMGALTYLDSIQGTDQAARYLGNGTWQQWAQDRCNQAVITEAIGKMIAAIGGPGN